MKFRFDKKYLYWGLTGFFSIAGGILFYFLIFHTAQLLVAFSSLVQACMPIICGLILAYLLSPICSFFERKVLYPVYKLFKIDTERERTKNRIRGLAILLTMFLTIYLVYIFFSIVLSEVIASVQSIVLQSSIYFNNLTKWLENTFSFSDSVENTVKNLINTYSDELNQWLNSDVIPRFNVVIKEVSLSVIGVAKGLWNMVIGLIISIYVLASKEKFAGQAKKMAYAIFNKDTANSVISDFRYANKTFGSYISGKLIDSVIIGILCFIIMSILDLDYIILISVIVGVTNIIPFFGPFLGGIPSALLLLMVNPSHCWKFIILIVLLQQFDGNILGPKILGDSTGLSSFWVIFSITVFGAYFGIVGMAIGVPVFALIYAAIRRQLNKMLKNKGLATDTDPYMLLDRIEGDEMIPLTEEKRRDARRSDYSASRRKEMKKLNGKIKDNIKENIAKTNKESAGNKKNKSE